MRSTAPKKSSSATRKSSSTNKKAKSVTRSSPAKNTTIMKNAALSRGKSDLSVFIEEVETELIHEEEKEAGLLDSLIDEIEAASLSSEAPSAADPPPNELVFVTGALRPDVTDIEGAWKAHFTDSAQWCPATLCGAQLFADTSGFAANLLGVEGEVHGFVGKSARPGCCGGHDDGAQGPHANDGGTFLVECDKLEGYPHICDRKEVIVTLSGGSNGESAVPFGAVPGQCLRVWVYYRRGGQNALLTPVVSNDWADANLQAVDQESFPALSRTASGRAVEVTSRGLSGGIMVVPSPSASSNNEVEPLCRTSSGRARLGEATPQEEVCPHIALLEGRYTAGQGAFEGIDECANPKCGRSLFNWACLGCKKVFCSNQTTTLSHFAESPSCGEVGIEMSCVTLKPYCRICDRSVGDKDHPREATGPLRTALEAVHMAKYGHLNGLRDMVSELSVTMAGLTKTRALCNSTCEKWVEMKEEFSNALDRSLEQIGAAMGVSGLVKQPHPKPGSRLTPEQRHSVLGGKPALRTIAERLKKGQCRKVVVLTGAGVSVSCGIPDFRSPGTGLYHNLSRFDLPSPEAIFDMGYFRENPEPFYTLARDLYPGFFTPSLAHAFVVLLERKGLLLRNFTQNIDCLERVSGVTPARLVEAHGSFAGAKCVECGVNQDSSRVRDRIMQGHRPMCDHCEGGGLVKPRITFFGEDLPQRYKDLSRLDMREADLVIVMGTSLRVMPFASLPGQCGETCPRLLINREEVGNFDFRHKDNYRDVFHQGDCDAGARELARQAGWEKDLDEIYATLTTNKMQTWDLDRYLSDFPPSVAEEACGLVQGWCSQGKITPKQAKLARKAIEEQAADVTAAYQQYMESGEADSWKAALLALAKAY